MAPSRGGLLLAALCACSLFRTASPRLQTDGPTARSWAGVLAQGRESRQAGGNSRTARGCDAALDPRCRERLATMLLTSGRFLQAGQPGAGRLDTLRGGGPTRAEMEEKMLAERAAALAEEERIKDMQKKKKRDREDANMKALVPREADTALALMLQKRQRLLPEGELTLDKIATYADAVYKEGDVDEAIAGYNRVLSVDPTDASALFNLATIYEKGREILKKGWGW
ncbi:hypothetical protein T484DRAFT_1891492 [Baffinella frigidus]|nr:hypothetical protein T484DRAFT_1891492 [Cryptophyta sp. CCMP2293]